MVQSGPADSRSLAVALGANLGDPHTTLLAVRPLLKELLLRWWLPEQGATPRLRWSPLFRTAPVGGPADQPPYLNAVVVVDGGSGRAPADRPALRWGPQASGWRQAPAAGEARAPEALPAQTAGDRPQRRPGAAAALPVAAAAEELLEQLLALERRFGRVRTERWGPRSLDLDLLWCGALAVRQPGLCLPHPQLRARAFVLAPLAAIDAGVLVPGDGAAPPAAAGDLLAALPPQGLEPPPLRLPGVEGWPE